MIHVPLLERIWLVPFSLILPRAFICIVSLLVALVAQHLANVLHKVVIVVVLAMLTSMVVTIPCSEIVVVPGTIMAMAIHFMVLISIATMVVVSIASMHVVSRISIPVMGGTDPLMWSRVVIVAVLLRFSI